MTRTKQADPVVQRKDLLGSFSEEALLAVVMADQVAASFVLLDHIFDAIVQFHAELLHRAAGHHLAPA